MMEKHELKKPVELKRKVPLKKTNVKKRQRPRPKQKPKTTRSKQWRTPIPRKEYLKFKSIFIKNKKPVDLDYLMNRYFPPLAHLPAPEYRAFAELILFSIAARYHMVYDDYHPTFLIYGSTQKFKSQLGEFISYMIGLEPELVRIDLQAETKKSTAFRRDAKGQITFKRNILESPFVFFDEWGFADEEVRRGLLKYINGKIKVQVENEVIIMRPVPMIASNPIRSFKSTVNWSLYRRDPVYKIVVDLKMDEPIVRRNVTLFVDRVDVDNRTLVMKGYKLLNFAKKTPSIPINIFKPMDYDVISRDVGKIFDILKEVVKPKVFKTVIDVYRVGEMVRGATAYIPDPDDAMKRVLDNYIKCLKTVNFTI